MVNPVQVQVMRFRSVLCRFGSRVAEQNNQRFIPAVFSYTGQIRGEFKRLIREQIRHKLICFEGEAKKSKVRSAMKWWSKFISMTTTKMASRNVAFKASRLSESVLESQGQDIIIYFN